MEIILGKTAGFCYGVKRAVNGAMEEIQKSSSPVYCLGELVHNQQVVNKLEQMGMKFIESIEEAKGKTIIRAHGIPKEVYELAQKQNVEIKDLTCQKVVKIHELVQQYSNQGWYIFIIGEKKHPETIGTISFCGKDSSVISNKEEIEEGMRAFEKTGLKKIYVISQTTYNNRKFDEIVDELKNKLDSSITVEVKKTICTATELRQKETEEISKQVEAMIIIGGKNSSNTNKLYEIASKECPFVVLVETKNNLDLKQFTSFQTIGVMAGASTPQTSIDEIIQALNEVKKDED